MVKEATPSAVSIGGAAEKKRGIAGYICQQVGNSFAEKQARKRRAKRRELSPLTWPVRVLHGAEADLQDICPFEVVFGMNI